MRAGVPKRLVRSPLMMKVDSQMPEIDAQRQPTSRNGNLTSRGGSEEKKMVRQGLDHIAIQCANASRKTQTVASCPLYRQWNDLGIPSP